MQTKEIREEILGVNLTCVISFSNYALRIHKILHQGKDIMPIMNPEYVRQLSEKFEFQYTNEIA